MARRKKTEIQSESIDNSDEALLSKEQVTDVLEFARALAGTLYPAMLTPEMVSARLKEISYSPYAPTQSDLDKALADPKNSEDKLRSFVEYYELISAPFRRIISYLASQLSLDLQYTITNVENPSEYNGKAFKEDQKLIFEFLDRFDYHYHFRNAVKQILRNEMFICSIRTEGQQIVLQELPLEYCRISSKWDYGYLADFDFRYFLMPGVSLDGYSNFFKRKFNELFVRPDGSINYNPLLPPEQRGSSQFGCWVSLPPEEGWVFKFDPSLAVGVPYLTSLLPEFINQSVMRNLQKNINLAEATKIMAGTIPLLKDQSAKVSNALALDAKVTGHFMSIVRNALVDSVKLGVGPIDDWKAISFDGNSELYDDWLRTTLASSGQNTAMFYTSKLKANAIESQLSFQSDSLICEQQLYPQFASMMNYLGSKITKKYKYKFMFEGNAYYLDRDARMTNAKDLASLGIVLPQKFASALGMKPHDFYRMLQESKAMKFTDMLTPIVTAFQQSGAESGRPEKPDSKLTDSGEQTRSDAENVGRGGKP